MTFLSIWTQRAAKSEKCIKTYENFIIQKKNREKLKQTTSKDIAAESAPGSSRERPLEDISSRERVEDSKKLAISVGGQSAKPLVAEAEAALSCQNFTTVKNEEDVWDAYRCLQDNKNVVISLYQNSKMKKGDMKRETFMKKSKDCVCARERL
ncbi:hypothetical protein BD560DRAFT_433519 [Blakeslea trispora]|nr:hypothetical protein BD560DRAFT_433519 [Blakeslea trispora]